VASVLFEVGGLFLVALHLWRVQQRELGMPGWWLDLGRLLRVTRQAEAESVSIEAAGEVATAGEASADARRGAVESLESRVDALNANLAALEQEMQTRAQQQDRMQAVIEEAQAELERHLDESDDHQRERLRESTTTQWEGTALFFVGAVLAGVANGVC
jgi:small-conductance mechanosensitive channel